MHAVLVWVVRVPGITTDHDDAWYIVLAQAVRQLSYVELPYIGTPPHTMYPPFYPALLAVLGVTSPDRVSVAVAANIVLSMLTLILVAKLTTRIAPWLAVAVVAVCACNPLLIDQASGVRSEPLYAAASMAALVLLVSDRRDPRSLLGTAGAVITATMARAIGGTLVIAATVELLLGRRWRSALWFLVPTMLVVGSWSVWATRAPRSDPGRSYLADATVVYAAPAPQQQGTTTASGAPTAPKRAPERSVLELARRRVVHNIRGYFRWGLLGALATPMVPGTRIDSIVALVVILTGCGAGFVALVRLVRPVVLYLIVYGTLLAAWPYVLTRFLGPVLPLIVLALLAGVWCVAQLVARPRVAQGAVWAVAAVLVVSALQQDVTRIRRVARCDRAAPAQSLGCFTAEQRDFFSALETVRRVAAPSARLLGSKDAAVHLLTGRQLIPENDALAIADPAAFAEFIQQRGIQFILLSRLHVEFAALSPVLLPRCRDYDLVGSFGSHVALLHVPLAGATRAADAGSDACAAIARWSAGDWSEMTGSLW